MTKVVQLTFRLLPSGDFARRYHNEFLKWGVQSSILSLESEVPLDDKTFSLGRKEKIKAKVDSLVQSYLTRDLKKNYGQFTYPVAGTNVAELEEVKNADVILLHWVLLGFLTVGNMEQLAKLGKPMIFILHDMWSLTGGCHYSFDCEKYKTGCHTCPMFTTGKKNDLSAMGFKRKLKFYSKYDNLYFVSPSKWLYDCAKASALTKDKPVFHIPNILDHELFKPVDKKIAKYILNIDEDEIVLTFGAVSIQSPFKGWKYLKAAMDLLHQKVGNKKITVLLFGGANNVTIVDSIPFKTKNLGRVRDEYTMTLLYNASDVFIAPSLADNLPYTIFESLSCGTPVVAFNTGGIPDLIEHKKNGYLAEYKNAEDMTEGIEFCLEHGIKGHVLSDLDSKQSMQKHLELFDRITNPNHGNGE